MLPDFRPRRSARLVRLREMARNKRPVIKSKEELMILLVEMTDESNLVSNMVEWIHFSTDDKAFMGFSHKSPQDITLNEFTAGLEPLDDNDIYPEIPANTPVTIYSEDLAKGAAFVKRCGTQWYQPPRQLAEQGFPTRDLDDGYGAKDELLREVFALEKLSKTPHPYIVRYLGCKIHNGRITAIILESLRWTLRDYAHRRPDRFAQLDKEAFLAGVDSAVDYMHSLGLTHNDISSRNIMVREADDGSCSPVLIDFDFCGPFGGRLVTSGSPGFSNLEDPELFISLKRHDDLGLTACASGGMRSISRSR